METLKLKFDDLAKGLKRLSFMIKKYLVLREAPTDFELDNDYIMCRDALIKRFEICFDLTWKFFKEYLRVNNGAELNSPKKVFHECFINNFVNEKEAQELLLMVEARNYTSHAYNEFLIDQICYDIPNYHNLMRKLTINIKIESTEPVKQPRQLTT